MNDWIDIEKNDSHTKREKAKAAELRKTNWWQTELARGICHYCKRTFSPGELTMDHVVPLARGGRSTRGNIVPCCKECNNKKKYYTPVDMILDEMKEEPKKS